MSKKKLFVIDTNVLAHDWRSVFKFQDNDICIPFTVVQELDNLKTKSNVSYNVRHFLKFLDKFDGNIMNKNLISEGLGNIHVLYLRDEKFTNKHRNKFKVRNEDDEIIMHAMYLIQENKKSQEYEHVILVTRDAGMRVKASALGLQARDYLHDSVQIDNLFKGKQEIIVPDKLIYQLNQNPKYIAAEDVKFLSDVKADYNFNTCFVLKSDRKKKRSALACLQRDGRDNLIQDTLTLIQKEKKSQRIKVDTINAEQTMAYHLLMNKDINLVTINGLAGTGKTLLSLLSGIKQVVLGSSYKKIVAMRPLVALSNKEIGFLPGNEEQKIGPYMRPLYDNLDFIKARSSQTVKDKIKESELNGILNIQAMAHIRGRTYNDTFIIIDEAQNLTPMEAKTLITRIGTNTKMVLVGDIFQTDSPYLNESSNGLSHVIDKFYAANYPFYGHITLEKGERSEIASLGSKIL